MKGLSRAALETIVGAIPAGVIVLGKEGLVLYANNRASKLFGIDITGRKLSNYAVTTFQLLALNGGPYSIKDIPALMAIRNGKEDSVEMMIQRPDGSRIVVSTSAMPIADEKGEVIASVSIFDDITERKKWDDVLRENQERLELAQRVARLGSWEVFVKEDRAVWSKEMFNLFELESSSAPNISAYTKLIHPDDRNMVRTIMERFIAEGKSGETVSFDYRVMHPDGSVCYLHSERMIRDVDDKGNAVRIVGIEQDITERKEAEVALRESEERFKLVAEAANVFVYEVDYIDNTLTVFRGEEVLGYKPREVPRSMDWWSKQIHPDDKAMVQQKAQKATEAGRDLFIEYRMRRKQGDFVIVHDTASMVKDDHGKVIRIVGGLRDVTERKENEKALLRSKQLLEEKAAEVEKFANSMEQLAQERTRQLQEAERLAAIGKTAGMVGHDIRNPLQAISGDVYLLKDYLTSMPESPTKRDVEDSLNGIEKNISYINKIVADLQDYSRKLTPDYHFVNLTEIVRQTLKAVDVPDNVIVTNNTGYIELRTDPEYVRRALTNLINNAVQAMPNGGNLTVAAHENHKETRTVLTVADTGVGIPESVKQKIFTPMVTTKSKGQGLGLAVVKRLIEALGGTISFESKEGKGTKFIIDLPAKGA